jgi:AcrR family transcriptional regulator
VRRTKTSLHNALIGLAREKPYSSIAVKEILDRANVGRSTFYTHFRDKDDLLDSGIHELLRSIDTWSRSSTGPERLVAFSLPALQHIEEHRKAGHRKMPREGRIVMHEHLQDVLVRVITDELEKVRGCMLTPTLPADLIAHYLAGTFVLVLNWWVSRDAHWTAADADRRFRDLVTPTLRELFDGSH